MSDASKEPGAPVEDPRPVDDVVGRAHEGLADAEAAQRDITPTSSRGESTSSRGEDIDYAMYEAAATPDSSDATPADAAATGDADAPTTAYASGSDAPTTAYTSSGLAAPLAAPAPVTASEPATEAYAAPAAAAPAAFASPQPIFVQAPEPPRPRGNRAAAGLIGLLAAVSFAVLYLGAALAIGLLDRSLTFDTVVDSAIEGLTSWWLWITTAVFFIGFWLLGAIINRGRWAHWVVWGLLIGFVAYGAHLVGQLFQAPFWQLTRSEGADLVEAQLVAPLAFAAFVIGRELTIWFGAWVAARGRRVSELNLEAQREYERTLEAGPTLARSAQG
ncbi:MAG: ABC transporter [Microbacterium sp.]|uniref:ABC transporter n=1 Tax=Microbacterium sp. TaxID=51671 RepID=UPI00271F5ED7|nr:ABC transporter [Microbacterium sp.]MDO8382192.1 ABC transporter [Microbacterium sp.]